MQNFSKEKIIIIDDDAGVVKTITTLLESMGISFDFSFNLTEGLSKVAQYDFDVVLLDVNLPDGDGIANIPDLIDKEFAPLVIIMTAYSNPDGAELAIENGAWDYLQKPVSIKDLKLQVLRALQFQNQKKQVVKSKIFDAPDIIGSSKAIQKCLTQAAQIVSSDGNLLITGATGTGKELFAKAIHENSARRNSKFIVVDCSVLSETLIESVLFGHEKGAFTGAEKRRNGLVALANGGTLFLDEVGELPESIQSSFLRVLQEKKFRPVGSEKEVYSDFRVICATNKDLEKMVVDHTFRMDLFYRLKSFVLHLPPLKEREGDIGKIAMSQIKICCEQHHIPEKQVAPDFVETLEKYDWPGNVRELINAMETSVTAAQFESMLFAFHLPKKIRAQVTRKSIKTEPFCPMFENNRPVVEMTSLKYKDLIDKIEKEYFKTLYSSVNGDIQKLIVKTGISRAALYRKLKRHKIK